MTKKQISNRNWRLAHKKEIRGWVEEIAKCDLVCANCHRDRTYKRSH